MDELDDTRQRFTERYEEGHVPWDDPLPPPEILELAETRPPGRALDVGCGFGRAAIYLAQRGWTVVGVDFIPQAIDEARRRAADAGVAERTRFVVASATDLTFLAPPFDLVIDVGCAHSFADDMLRRYSDELARLLAPGGEYILHARLRDSEAAGEERPHGLEVATLLALLADDFVLERQEYGTTRVEDRPPWNSAWFWFRRAREE
ncbi:MAG TPA: class I SAM-dependent methyltransferase [Promineifilum sp.]|nr:class I SAM-dependent methyltransferase [Promineifilum sp.]